MFLNGLYSQKSFIVSQPVVKTQKYWENFCAIVCRLIDSRRSNQIESNLFFKDFRRKKLWHPY